MSELAAGRPRILTPAALGLVMHAAGLVSALAVFGVLTLTLEPAEYGTLAAVYFYAAALGPVSSGGSVVLLSKYAATSDELGSNLGMGTSITAVGTLAASVVIVSLQPVLASGVPRLTLMWILVAQLVLFWLAEVPVGLTVGLGRIDLSATIRVVNTIVRVGSASLFLYRGESSLYAWGLYSTVAGVIGASGSYLVIGLGLSIWPSATAPTMTEFRKGLPFAFGQTTEGLLDASDRPIMLNYGYAADTGRYSAAYRIVSMGYIPLMALLTASTRSMFQAGEHGLRAGYSVGTRVLRSTLLVSTATSFGLVVVIPFAVRILPDAYAETRDIVWALAALPIIKAVQFTYGNVLTMSGRPQTRLRLTIVATVANLGLGFALIPGMSWEGAAISTLISEVLLTILVWLVASSRAPSSFVTRAERVGSPVPSRGGEL